ncbi:hypothetical protein ACFWMP_31440 [Paenibacillus sp. NPDC058367]|uniref:hypothetical protein n=1 Tax=Paenibacillus sp. NPDC058367 TaxID=3346460 RepID=UPI0036490FA2
MFGGILDAIITWLEVAARAAILLLPQSPFADLSLAKFPETFGNVMGWINYFVPIGAMLGIMTTYLAAVMIWYTVRWILRLTQYID